MLNDRRLLPKIVIGAARNDFPIGWFENFAITKNDQILGHFATFCSAISAAQGWLLVRQMLVPSFLSVV